MNKRAVVVIIKDEQILLMHRFSNAQEYYCLPGGNVEDNETVEQAAIREAKEEATLDVKLDRLLWEYKDEFDGRTNYFFLVTEFLGDAKLSGPELERNSDQDKYILEWHNLTEIKNLLLYPIVIKEKVIENFSH